MINFDYLIKAGLSTDDYILMVKVFQKDFHLLTKEDKEAVDRLLEKEYFALLKTGKTLKDKLRISPKGKAFLENLAVPNINDEVIDLEKKLRELYEEYNKIVGKDILKKLAWFKDVTGFRNKIIYDGVLTHLQEDSFTYTLSNLIWKAENVFSAKWSLDGSYLFELISKVHNYNRNVFTDERDKSTHFLLHFGSTLPPKGLDKDWYFKGSYEADVEHITNLATILTEKIKK